MVAVDSNKGPNLKVVKWCLKRWNGPILMHIYDKQCEIIQTNWWKNSNFQIQCFYNGTTSSSSSSCRMLGELGWEHCTFFPFPFSHQTSKVSNLREARFRLGWPCRLFALLPKLNQFCRAAEDGIRLKEFWIKGMQNSGHSVMTWSDLWGFSYRTQCEVFPRN